RRQIDVAVLRLEHDRTAVGFDQPDDHVKRGRFSGAVGTEQSDDLAGADFRADTVDDDAFAVPLHEAAHPDLGHLITVCVKLMSDTNVLPVNTSWLPP